MTCYHPIKAYRSKSLTVNGKRQLVFDESKSNGDSIEIPCGRCIGCKLQRSLDWATRISHEASLNGDNNCFVTLTYSPENLPQNGTLVLAHHQQFLKRLKSAVRYKYGKLAAKKIRFFMCGEYGDELQRPHYHYCLLGWDFPDKVHYKSNGRGDRLYKSQMLQDVWPYGFANTAAVTFESAAYVARYCTKKLNGPLAETHYSRIDVETGEIISKKPEFTAMSLKPGIGEGWLQKFSTDVTNGDYVVTRAGAKMRPPRYYDKKNEVLNPEKHRKNLIKRESNLVNIFGSDEYNRRALDNTSERLKVKETVQLRTVQQSLNRKMEME
ncbi:replication initiator protein [Blackfly microvirus SF02]|uniref:Replication initiator protein n=1 Tax=Blackfly microvirus SF02 TaxID=2576452 RepID=A0A4P8PKN5_9VIRU|nr:replication initiator protein [Blackfly microvirus SF02]